MMSEIISKLFIATILLTIIPMVSANVCVCTGDPVEPSYGIAEVDGNSSEWNLTKDYFGTMYQTGISTNVPLSDAYVRYDCENQILYVLVLLKDGEIIDNTGLNPKENHFVKMGCGGPAVVDAWDENSGTQPNFMYIENATGVKIGWEASAEVSPDTSALSIHTQVCDDETSAFDKRCINLGINCHPIPEFPTITLPIAAILGLMFILQSRRRKED